MKRWNNIELAALKTSDIESETVKAMLSRYGIKSVRDKAKDVGNEKLHNELADRFAAIKKNGAKKALSNEQLNRIEHKLDLILKSLDIKTGDMK